MPVSVKQGAAYDGSSRQRGYERQRGDDGLHGLVFVGPVANCASCSV